MANCLITLLAHYYFYFITSSFPRFILSYYFKLVTLDFNGKKNYHYKCAVGINHSYRSSRLHSLVHETTLTKYSVIFFFAKSHEQL